MRLHGHYIYHIVRTLDMVEAFVLFFLQVFSYSRLSFPTRYNRPSGKTPQPGTLTGFNRIGAMDRRFRGADSFCPEEQNVECSLAGPYLKGMLPVRLA